MVWTISSRLWSADMIWARVLCASSRALPERGTWIQCHLHSLGHTVTLPLLYPASENMSHDAEGGWSPGPATIPVKMCLLTDGHP